MKIVVGYDDSNAVKEAINVAIKHAKAFNAGIDIVFSAIERTDEDREFLRRTQEEMDEMKQKVIDAGIECTTHLFNRDLTPEEDLVQYAKDNDVDEIIIGVRKRSQLGKVIFGSHAQSVIMNAPCPVLCVKAKN